MRLAPPVIGCFVALTGTAHANIRAPERGPRVSSSAIHGLGTEGLTVKGEELSFDCERDGCAVSARYSIEAQEPVRTSLQFIVPDQPAAGRLMVRSRRDARPVAVATVELTADEKAQLPAWVDHRRLLRASFEVAFTPGSNELIVEYQQPLRIHERDYSYFHRGTLLRLWDYELWPIKEWHHGSSFAVAIRVSVPRSPPSRWQRWFGRVESVACAASTDGIVDQSTTAQRGERLEYRTRISDRQRIPSTLRCTWGEEKHLSQP
jgi:hypothetical protein